MPNRDMLADLVPRVVNDPDFVAWALAEYRRIEGISEEKLREQLNIDPSTYLRLSLCEMPSNDPKHFRRHIQEISTYTGVDAALLANLFREVAAMESLPKRTLQGESSAGQTSVNPAPARKPNFMAARDRRADSASVAEKIARYQPDHKALPENAEESRTETKSSTETEPSTQADPAQPASTQASEKSSDDHTKAKSDNPANSEDS